MILAVDPGSTQSAYVVYDPKIKTVKEHAIMSNMGMRSLLEWWNGILMLGAPVPHEVVVPPDGNMTLVIEDMQSFGMPVGREVFETVRWTGRFDSAWFHTYVYIPRSEVKLAICKSAKANDASIRTALIDMFGGKQETKKGGKLYKVKGDEWSALALAVTHSLKK